MPYLGQIDAVDKNVILGDGLEGATLLGLLHVPLGDVRAGNDMKGKRGELERCGWAEAAV